jgi:hypothetical protein
MSTKRQFTTWLFNIMLQYNNMGVDLKKAIMFLSKSTNIEAGNKDNIIKSFIFNVKHNFNTSVYKKGELYYINNEYITKWKIPLPPADSKLIDPPCDVYVSIHYRKKLFDFIKQTNENATKNDTTQHEPPAWDSNLIWPSVKVGQIV